MLRPANGKKKTGDTIYRTILSAGIFLLLFFLCTSKLTATDVMMEMRQNGQDHHLKRGLFRTLSVQIKTQGMYEEMEKKE